MFKTKQIRKFDIFLLLRCYIAEIFSYLSTFRDMCFQSQIKEFSWTAWPLTMRPIGYSETSITKKQTVLRNIKGEWRSHLKPRWKPENMRFRKKFCKYFEAFGSFIYIRHKQVNKFSLVCSKWCECKELVFICVKVSELLTFCWPCISV
jgi:hypothetical protein